MEHQNHISYFFLRILRRSSLQRGKGKMVPVFYVWFVVPPPSMGLFWERDSSCWNQTNSRMEIQRHTVLWLHTPLPPLHWGAHLCVVFGPCRPVGILHQRRNSFSDRNWEVESFAHRGIIRFVQWDKYPLYERRSLVHNAGANDIPRDQVPKTKATWII